ncbi:methyltransferase domain-containing protein [Thermoflexus sp.]|uniref:methyltransferase domain-containing protein n=1 Tax=Thermoflexus sp. TaxID=1969742 RepID=UPI0035E44545
MSDEFESIRFSADEAARIVRESYGAVIPQGMRVAESLYSPDEIAWLPESVTAYALGLGNPVRYADLQPGEVVLDIGSGAGIDTFLAAKKVGPTGRAIGLDMTPEMLARARANQRILGMTNVEFREGKMEQIPLDDASVDVIISNGVINLSTEKGQAFREFYRVLKPGGRLIFADSVVNGHLPRAVLDSEAAFAG